MHCVYQTCFETGGLGNQAALDTCLGLCAGVLGKQCYNFNVSENVLGNSAPYTIYTVETAVIMEAPPIMLAVTQTM